MIRTGGDCPRISYHLAKPGPHDQNPHTRRNETSGHHCVRYRMRRSRRPRERDWTFGQSMDIARAVRIFDSPSKSHQDRSSEGQLATMNQMDGFMSVQGERGNARMSSGHEAGTDAVDLCKPQICSREEQQATPPGFGHWIGSLWCAEGFLDAERLLESARPLATQEIDFADD